MLKARRFTAMVVAAVAGGLAFAGPAGAGKEAPITVAASESGTAPNRTYAFTPIANQAPGRYGLLLDNTALGNLEPHLIGVGRLGNGLEDEPDGPAGDAAIMDAVATNPDFFSDGSYTGVGFASARVGDTDKGRLKLSQPGSYAYFCFVHDANDVPHYQNGMFGRFTVSE